MTDLGRPAILIVAISGRALVAAARKAGFAPLVADLFGDLDTRGLADAWAVVPGDLALGFDREALLQALEALATGREPLGIVYGGGFDGRPDLIADLGERWPLLGNDAETTRLIKHPLRFAALCRELDIPHPGVATLSEIAPGKLLVKRAGGSGGTHVRHFNGAPLQEGEYLQPFIGERSVSALFCAGLGHCEVIGFSEQWTDPDAAPFAYGGAARPAALDATMAVAMAEAVKRISQAAGLNGLNSADFRLDREKYWLIEINPRPGGSLDVFHDRNGQLFAYHVAACRGELPPEHCRATWAEPLIFDDAAVAEILYATRCVSAVPACDWPEWTADRQAPDTRVERGWPLCTITARAGTVDEARALSRSRKAAMRAILERG
ncbi:ATP-grasp domain-containing protein [Rhodoligotrophos ferricapiens]|uniref:ATP-grasp domain-containing protein n=1 Tax=Rhodoligotrophos ferricapiens TaxID=3069264 RepID=UPI00315D60D0